MHPIPNGHGIFESCSFCVGGHMPVWALQSTDWKCGWPKPQDLHQWNQNIILSQRVWAIVAAIGSMGVCLPNENIADILDSYKYFAIVQASK